MPLELALTRSMHSAQIFCQVNPPVLAMYQKNGCSPSLIVSQTFATLSRYAGNSVSLVRSYFDADCNRREMCSFCSINSPPLAAETKRTAAAVTTNATPIPLLRFINFLGDPACMSMMCSSASMLNVGRRYKEVSCSCF